MLRRIARILFGFFLACLAAAAVTTVFADIQELKSAAGTGARELLATWGVRVLRLATIGAMFAAPIAFVGILFGEWKRIQDWAYYAVLALFIATLGFLTWYKAETAGGATIINNYAMTAFLTSGFVGGLIYWLFSGHNAGKPYARVLENETFSRTETIKPASGVKKPKPFETPKPELTPPDLKKIPVSAPKTVEKAATSAEGLVKKAGTSSEGLVEKARTNTEGLVEKMKDAAKTAEEAAELTITQGAKTAQSAAKTAEEAARKATSVPETTKISKKD